MFPIISVHGTHFDLKIVRAKKYYIGPDHLESKMSIILGKKNLKSLLSSTF